MVAVSSITLQPTDSLLKSCILGALSYEAGERLNSVVRIHQDFGSTEAGPLPKLASPAEDWQYHFWHPTHSGIEMRESVDGLREMVIVRRPELDLRQAVFVNFPDLSEWPMNDLYSPHPDPSKPYLWLYQGRTDDVIVLANGEKVQPVAMEAAIMRSSLVSGVLIVGQGKLQTAALIELKDDLPESEEERTAVDKELRSLTEEANKQAMDHAKLYPQQILLTTPEKPMARSAKGTIQRASTTALYAQEIEHFYASVDERSSAAGTETQLDPSAPDSIEAFLRSHITAALDVEEFNNDDDDLFERGLNSLQVIHITRSLKATLTHNGLPNSLVSKISPAAFYTNPSLNALVSAILAVTTTETTAHKPKETFQDMQETYDKYAAMIQPRSSIPHLQESDDNDAPRSWNVVLTGSTGQLGSYILHSLCNLSYVANITCLNRSADAKERQLEIQRMRGLDLDHEKVVFLKADLSKDRLGLCEADYDNLVKNATHIIREFVCLFFHSFSNHAERTKKKKSVCLLIHTGDISNERYMYNTKTTNGPSTSSTPYQPSPLK